MLESVSLPWWGWTYLLLVLAIYAASFFTDDIRFDKNELVGSVLSLFCICVFVVSFFNPFVARFFGFLLIPMTLLGIYWEFTRAIKETRLAEDELAHEKDLSEEEQKIMLNLAIGVNALVVLPGYVMGILLCLNVFGF